MDLLKRTSFIRYCSPYSAVYLGWDANLRTCSQVNQHSYFFVATPSHSRLIWRHMSKLQSVVLRKFCMQRGRWEELLSIDWILLWPLLFDSESDILLTLIITVSKIDLECIKKLFFYFVTWLIWSNLASLATYCISHILKVPHWLVASRDFTCWCYHATK